MRLTFVILIATLMQVSATGFAQKITLTKSNAALKAVLKDLKIQSGYNFVYTDDILAKAKPVDISVKEAAFKEVLDKIFNDQPLTYTIDRTTITVKEKEPSLLDKARNVLDRLTSEGRYQDIDVRGVVVGEKGELLPGATVTVKGTERKVITNGKGEFYLQGVEEKAVLVISYTGYERKEIKVAKDLATIELSLAEGKLDEVEVVSTGYQDIPKERATGSFTLIDNKTLNRTVSPDLLSRLNGVTNGLLSDKTVGSPNNKLGISIRGQSTIFSNSAPLVILDNFPFEGEINTINPEMVESVTILKDAAAASIWGAFSGNGVIVITTKKGTLNQAPTINLKSDLTIGAKPDLYYEPQLTSGEFIDVEQFLFSKGKYTADINNGYSFISPVVAILDKIEKDAGYASQGMAEIEFLRKIDARDQLSKYFYRNSTQQRYYAEVAGGGNSQTYSFSAGYDKNLPSSIALSDSRLTLKGNNSYNLIKNRLKLNTDITFSKSKSNDKNGSMNYAPFLPYEQVADENGNPLATLPNGGLRASYTDVAGEGRLLDWKYRPLDEIREGYSQKGTELTDYRINLSLNYKVIEPLSISLNYQYYSANIKRESSNGVDSYYTRNQINTYSQINTTTGQVKTPFPIGDIFFQAFENRYSNSGRVQLNFNQTFLGKHAISAIAGFELRDVNGKSSGLTLYGYSAETATSVEIDRFSQFPNYYTGTKSTIGSKPTQSGTTDRFVSRYGNISYIYDNKYIISGSYRKDESNLFGVKANQKGVPLWSAGLAWNLYKEPFFAIDWLSFLQLKTTYGYNGNVNTKVSASLTAQPSSTNLFTNSQYYQIVNPPNKNLRWERVKNINAALAFSTKKERFSGSIEYYIKNGMDLIASSPIAPQTGISLFTGNTADTRTKGIDIQFNSRNIDRVFKWNTIYIFNYAKDKITNYKVKVGSNDNVVAPGSISPIQGYPINAIFAYKWAGLDTYGNPQGYLEGAISLDYTKISNSTDINQLQFFGSKIPTTYGSLRNNLSYKNLELSFNLVYKMGYYFRRRSLNYSTLYTGTSFKQNDYENRWLKAGDEIITNVPSLIYPGNNLRDSFYENSAVLIEKSDHIRLQDIQFNYSFTKKQIRALPFDRVNIYAYITNIGLILKGNKQGLDPEVSTYPSPRTIAFGIQTNF